jgi:hypothetical protein
MSVIRRLPSRSSRAVAIALAAVTGTAVLTAAPPALAAAPDILSVSPAATVGMGAGQSGHGARQITITVDNVATTDTVTVTFPGFTGLSASVVTPLTTGGGHTLVTANVSTSPSSVPSSGFNLTLTDVTTSSSDTTSFAIVAAPAVSSASPSRLVRGTTTSVTLTGTGMQSGVVASASAQSGVTFGAVAVGGGGTTGTVSVTVSNSAPSGPLALTLTNPDAGWSTQSGAISIDSFPVTDISPASATNATSNTAVLLTVAGQGIPAGNTVLRLTPTFAVTGQDPIVVSPTAIAASGQQWQGNANLVGAAPGNYQVQLVNGSDTGTLTTKSFTVSGAGAPTITTVSPTTLGQGASTTLTLTGTNFARGATVTFSKAAFTTMGPVVFVSTTQIQVPVHVAANAATGGANATNVTVTNTGPTPNAGTKNAALQASAGPTISSLAPSPIGQGAATTLTITGSNFQSQATITFGTGVTATGGISAFSSTQIKLPVKVASNAPSKVDVTVKNPDFGSVTMQLTVNALTFASASPRYISSTFSGNLVLTGSGFRTGATVSFPAGSGVAVQSGKSATMSNNGATLTVPVAVTRTTAAAIDVTVTNTGTDLGTVTCTGCVGVAVAPSPPSGVVATKSGTTATVGWTAVTPPKDGGAPVTGYTVTVTSPANSGIAAQALGPNATSAAFTNLADDTDYVFAVTVTNAANLTSAPTSASTSRKSHLTLRAGALRVVTRQSVRLFGRLRDANGAPISGASILVTSRSDSGRRSNVGVATTDSSGDWSTIVRPRFNETYSASYAGDGTNEASQSATERVVATARVTIHGSATTQKLTVYGHVSPNKSGETVRLVALDRSGQLHRLGRTFLNDRSRYRFRIGLPDSHWRLQVRIRATGGNGAGRSSYLVVSG